MLVASSHTVFAQLSVAGLIPGIIAGVLGGIVAGAVAPHRKIAFSVLLGSALSAILLAFLLRNGFSPRSAPVLLWYWPAWLMPCYAIGGVLSRNVWRTV